METQDLPDGDIEMMKSPIESADGRAVLLKIMRDEDMATEARSIEAGEIALPDLEITIQGLRKGKTQIKLQ